MNERLPPHSREAEQGLIGGILRDPRLIDEVELFVRPESLYFHHHQLILRAIVDLHAQRRPIDLVTVFEELGRRQQTEDVTSAYLAELWDAVPTAANVAYYAVIVREKSALRRLLHLASEIHRDAHDEVASAESLAERAERCLTEIGQDSARTDETQTLAEVLTDTLHRIDQAATGKSGGIPTGLGELDQMLGGWHPGEMIVLGARPSVGKSAMANGFATAAATAGHRVLFVTLEMGNEEVGQRLLVESSSVPNWKIKRRQIGDDEARRLIEASDRLRKLPIVCSDRTDVTARGILSMARRMSRKGGLGLVVLDYLQLLQPENPRTLRQEQVAQASRSLKLLARELHVPVIVLTQLSRLAEQDGNRRPRLSDIRESGAVEQDADVVLFLHRPEAETRADPEIIELIVAKQRNGETGTLSLDFSGSLFRFDSRIPS